MKKIILAMGVAGIFASCTSDYTDWANPQSSAEESAKTVALTVKTAADVDFAEIADVANDSVQLFVPTVTASEKQATTYAATLFNADKSDSTALTANAAGKVPANDLKAATEKLYGKAPTKRDIALNIVGYTVIDGQSIRNTATSTLGVTLVAPFIDTAYYLAGDMTGWDVAGAKQFTQTVSGNQYDHPEFSIVFTTTADNQYWKIIPKTNYDGEFWAEGTTGVVGVATNGDDAAEGSLTTTKPQAGKIAEAGIYRMTINMMDYTYKIEKLNFTPNIYEVGNVGSWTTDNALDGLNFDGKYVGYAYLDGEFKFRPVAGSWASSWGGTADGTLSATGGNLSTEAGFYEMHVDLAAMTYNLVKVNTISLIGDFNSWGGDVDLIYNAAGGYWENSNVVLSNTGGLKFRMNHAWDTSWGGTLDKLTTVNGGNINVEAGTYDVKLYVSHEGDSKAVLTKK